MLSECLFLAFHYHRVVLELLKDVDKIKFKTIEDLLVMDNDIVPVKIHNIVIYKVISTLLLKPVFFEKSQYCGK